MKAQASNFKADQALRRARRRITLWVCAMVLVVVAPPVLFPEVRSYYAPIFDYGVLWIIGHFWHRILPLSLYLFLPLAFLSFFLLLAWLFRTRFINAMQLAVTKFYIRLCPRGGPYLFLKRAQVRGLRWKQRKNKTLVLGLIFLLITSPFGLWRDTFPLYLLAWLPLTALVLFLWRAWERHEQYLPESVSEYFLKTANTCLTSRRKSYWYEAGENEAEKLKASIIAVHEGLARIYVPNEHCAEAIDERNFALALAHLDEAQLYGKEQWLRIQTLFEIYGRKHDFIPGGDLRFLPAQVRARLENDGSHMDKTVLLRILINFWFHTRKPETAAVATGFVGEYLGRVARTFAAALERAEPGNAGFKIEHLPSLSLQGFHQRYLNFAEQARGRDFALQTRALLEVLAQDARRLLQLAESQQGRELFQTNPAAKAHVLRLAEDFSTLISADDFHHHARDWDSQRNKLEHFQDWAAEQMLVSGFKAGVAQDLKEQSGPAVALGGNVFPPKRAEAAEFRRRKTLAG